VGMPTRMGVLLGLGGGDGTIADDEPP